MKSLAAEVWKNKGANEALDKIFQAMFVSDTLTNMDLERGKLALKYPEVAELYQADMQNRLKRFEEVRVQYQSL